MSRTSAHPSSGCAVDDDNCSSSSDEDLVEVYRRVVVAKKKRPETTETTTRKTKRKSGYDSSSSSDCDLLEHFKQQSAASTRENTTSVTASPSDDKSIGDPPTPPAAIGGELSEASARGELVNEGRGSAVAAVAPKRSDDHDGGHDDKPQATLSSSSSSSSTTRPVSVACPPPQASDYGLAAWEDDEDDDQDNALLDVKPAAVETHASRKRPFPAPVVPRASFQPSDFGMASFAEPTPCLPTMSSRSFQVATYNVWCGVSEETCWQDPEKRTPDIAGWPHPQERMQAIASLLLSLHIGSSNPVWLVGFQEVSFPLAMHLYGILERHGYTLLNQVPYYGCGMAIYTGYNQQRGPGDETNTSDEEEQEEDDTDDDALTRLDSGCEYFDASRQGRAFLWARVRLPASRDELVFATCHLDSWTGGKDNPGCREREAQVKQLDAFLSKQMDQHVHVKAVIISGDLNWDDESKSKTKDPVLASILPNYQDAWLTTRFDRHETCYTYDGRDNVMRNNAFRRRLDRLLWKGRFPKDKCPMWATSTQLIGTETLAGLHWYQFSRHFGEYKTMATVPSDHFGFVAQMQYATEDDESLLSHDSHHVLAEQSSSPTTEHAIEPMQEEEKMQARDELLEEQEIEI